MLRPLWDILKDRNTRLVKSYRDKAAGLPVVTNIPTGLKTLDDCGIGEPGILTLIQGHPGDGKSSFVRQLTAGAAIAGYKPHAYILEDPEDFVSDNLTAKELNESSFKLRRYELDPVTIEERLKAAMIQMVWSKQVVIETELLPIKRLEQQLMDTVTVETGAVHVDYFQAYDAEAGESKPEVVSSLVRVLAFVAKTKKVAVFGYSQLKSNVEERGRRYFDNWIYNHKKEDMSPSEMAQAVEGYRPLSGDAQWSSAIYQRAKDSLSIFRPGKWLRQHGIDAKDNIMEAHRPKANFSPGQSVMRMGWKGETGTLSDLKLKERSK